MWESGVDGIIVGNTTKRRHDLLPADYDLPAREVALLLEQGGYSGPQLFKRTVSLTRRYREFLDEGMDNMPKESVPVKANAAATKADANIEISSRIQDTIDRDVKNLKPDTPEAHAGSKSQPLIQVPPRNNPFSSENASSPSSASSADAQPNQTPPISQSTTSDAPSPRKVIFATGGITNGKQALEVLEAGASVAQVYTALVYGGVGTIARMKDEMSEEMRRRGRDKGSDIS